LESKMKEELNSIREQKHEVERNEKASTEASKKRIACLEAQLEERDALIERARMESSSHVTDANERVKELEAKLTEVESELKSLRTAESSASKELNLKIKTVEALKTEVVGLQTRCDSLRLAREAAESKLDNVEAHWKADMDQKDESIKKMREDIERLIESAKGREARIEDLLAKASKRAGESETFEEVFRDEFAAMREAYEHQLNQVRGERTRTETKLRVDLRKLRKKYDDAVRSARHEKESFLFEIKSLCERLRVHEPSFRPTPGVLLDFEGQNDNVPVHSHRRNLVVHRL